VYRAGGRNAVGRSERASGAGQLIDWQGKLFHALDRFRVVKLWDNVDPNVPVRARVDEKDWHKLIEMYEGGDTAGRLPSMEWCRARIAGY
jgi:hypothetical protein